MIEEPKCSKRGCKHFLGIRADYDGEDFDESTERPFCLAFYEQIPDEIAYGNNPHFLVDPGQDEPVTFERGERSPEEIEELCRRILGEEADR